MYSHIAIQNDVNKAIDNNDKNDEDNTTDLLKLFKLLDFQDSFWYVIL
jgi:hypothetical protein